MEPAKFEVFVNPGQTVTKYLTITSRISQPTTFKITEEDFVGTDDPDSPLQLLGDERGPYSLKDFIIPEIPEFTLKYGERISLPIYVSVPQNTSPKGFYGAIIVATKPSGSGAAVEQSTRVVSRLGALFLVRVNGEAKESGQLIAFNLLGGSGNVLGSSPSGFEVVFKNDGNVHLVPHGLVRVTNLFGSKIGSVPVDAYFSLPDSTRTRDVTWKNPPFMIGRYSATLDFYKGYKNENEIRTLAFWVLPWKIVAPIFVAIVLIVSLLYYIITRFEFRRKK
jgi:hypothetical protein